MTSEVRAPPPSASSSHRSVTTGLDVGILALAVGLGSFAAWLAFPSWDDGALWLTRLEGGTAALSGWQSDRPVLGILTGVLARHELLWRVGAVLYAVTWALTAVVTLLMWRRFFPSWNKYGSVAALLAVSPVVVETQAVAINPVFSAHFGVAAVYLSQCLLWRGRRVGRPAALALAGAVVVSASLISEYAPLATVVASSAFLLLGELAYDQSSTLTREGKQARRRTWGVMIGCAAVGYVILHSLANAQARPEVRPELQMVGLGWRHFLLEVPLRLPFSLWTGLLGELLKDLGEINFSRATAWGIPFGVIVALLTVWRLRREPQATTPPSSDGEISNWRRGLALVLPMVIGVAAVIAMTSSIRGNVASRLWIPMLPVAACLSLFILLTLVRAKFHLVVAGACAFTAGYLEANAAAGAHRAARQMADLGAKLHQQLAPSGLTAALFVDFPTNHALGDPIPRPYELIAHLTRGWPENDRARFWAGAYSWQSIHESVPGLGGVCGPVTRIDSQTGRGWRRQGGVTKTLWVSFDADGQAFIQEVNPVGENSPPRP